jgi:hypothetical protein
MHPEHHYRSYAPGNVGEDIVEKFVFLVLVDL